MQQKEVIVEYYKKVDKSIFHDGTTLPKRYIASFTQGAPLQPGSARQVTLLWVGKGSFAAALRLVNRRNSTPVYQLRWDGNHQLLFELKKEFIQSYMAIESMNYKAKSEGRYFITDLLGGNQEVLIFRPIDLHTIELETFIKVSTPYDNIFKRLVEENVFGWLSKPNRDYLITKSTEWLDKGQLIHHQNAQYVVYYLIDEFNKEIYIGSAIRLGNRVKEGRSEIPGWTKFKYEIVHPGYHHLLRRIEVHAINAFASFFESNGKVDYYPVSEYKLVNKSWSKSR
jgi:hypothetical protein